MKNIEKFSNGPWKKDKHDALVDCEDKIITVSKLNICHAHYDDDVYTANSRLIESAPEMYEMLKIISDEARRFEIRNGATIQCREKAGKILAKARGEF